MDRTPFDIPFERLPGTIPIFPLAGVLLLPQGKLPLNVYEPRYLAMVDDALRGDRLVGMIQPSDPGHVGLSPPVHGVGCAGRITRFAETEDGRYLITLTGVCRFQVGEELPQVRGYRRVVPVWDRFRADCGGEPPCDVDRSRLLNALRGYFKLQQISADWAAIEATPDGKLVTLLAMICPFAPDEKQLLLEAPDPGGRAELLIALMEMAVVRGAATDGALPN
ncbi:MAG TPA: LON peptidase substrate-binding domain-containing protein [Azospirillaceae bacterium]|nr:LON peptidase substrate-binding domain-containing protein [Azospirillaceae bacterium]